MPDPLQCRADRYVAAQLARAAGLRAPDGLLRRDHSGAIYQIADRNGVTVIAAPTSGLDDEELQTLLRFRFLHYLAAGFVERDVAAALELDQEPHANLNPRDIHIVAVDTDSRDLLCYLALRAVTPALPKVRMRSRARPLFPVEEAHGIGLYDHVPGIAELPATAVRELGRFVRNQLRPPRDELSARASVEVCVGAVRVLAGPLRGETKALIGDVEDVVAKRNLDFFDFPTITIAGTVGFEPEGSYLEGRYAQREVFPIAGLCSDLVQQEPRLIQIEEALRLPGRSGIRELLALKRSANPPRSSLEPGTGLPALLRTPIEHRALSGAERARVRAAGGELRAARPFGRLSVAEATVLRSVMRERIFKPGETVVHRGDYDARLFVIVDGVADVSAEETVRLKPNDVFGEIALLFGGRRTADVVAVTELTVLELSQLKYEDLVADLSDIDGAIAQLAIARLAHRGGENG